MNLSLRSTILAAVAAMTLPAAASAATTFEVATAAQFTTAATDAVSGDTIHVKAGLYAANIDVKNEGVTIQADAGALLVNVADAATPTLTFSAASGTTPDVVTGLAVINTSTEGGGPAAIQAGVPGLTLQRAVVISAKGDALSSAAGASSSDRVLTVDSTLLVALDAGAAAIRATSANPLPTSAAGATQVRGRHITAVGDSSVIVDSSGANGFPGPVPPASISGNIAATFADSILLGKRTATANAGSLTASANTATINTDTRNKVADNANEAATLFVNPAKGNYHLRADSPAIGKGGLTEGEAATDFDGDERSSGGVSDQGADEFVNRAPTASLAAIPGAVRQGQPVVFDASKSSDPEAAIGGGIAYYHWEFGDGSTEDTTTAKTTHIFSERKEYSVTVTVTDKQGRASAASAPVTFTVLDGTIPTVTVGQPGAKQKLRMYKAGTKKRVRVTFFGTGADDTGLSKIYLALRPVASKNGQCRWFDGKTKLVKASCDAPTLLTARLTGSDWRYRLPLRAKLPRGPYQLIAVAQDASGLVSEAKVVAFRLR